MFPTQPPPIGQSRLPTRNSPSSDPAVVVGTMQVIRTSLVMGIVLMGAVSAFLVLSGGPALGQPIPNPLFPNLPLMLLIAAPIAVGGVLASVVVPGFIERQARLRLANEQVPDSDCDARLLAAHQSGSLIRGALIEVPSFFLMITTLAEGHWWGMIWASALQVVQLMTFPTRAGVENWLRAQKDLMESDLLN